MCVRLAALPSLHQGLQRVCPSHTSGRYVGLKDAKSVSMTQVQDVTITFSDFTSPWHTPAPWHCTTA